MDVCSQGAPELALHSFATCLGLEACEYVLARHPAWTAGEPEAQPGSSRARGSGQKDSACLPGPSLGSFHSKVALGISVEANYQNLSLKRGGTLCSRQPLCCVTDADVYWGSLPFLSFWSNCTQSFPWVTHMVWVWRPLTAFPRGVLMTSQA